MNQKKEFFIEYDFQSSPQLLYQYLSTPSGLSEWFSDDVNYRGEKYTFFWGESEEYARVITKKQNGKGLGLSIVSNSIRSLDGSIEVTSENGSTNFCLNFPLKTTLKDDYEKNFSS